MNGNDLKYTFYFSLKSGAKNQILYQKLQAIILIFAKIRYGITILVLKKRKKCNFIVSEL